MELRQTSLSKSAITFVYRNYDRNYADAYILSRSIASQFKHPILLDYKSKLDDIRELLGYSKAHFTKTLNNAIKLKLATIEGANLKLLSNEKDKQHYKQAKKNDYRNTSDPQRFVQLVLLQSLYYEQVASISKKQDQPELIVHNSDFADRLQKRDNNQKNYVITSSCRAVARKLNYKSISSAHKVLNELSKAGLIQLNKHKVKIEQSRAYQLMSEGFRYAVRFNTQEQEFYEVHPSTFKLNYTLRRTKPSKFDLLPEHEQVAYMEMGYSKEEINRLLK